MKSMFLSVQVLGAVISVLFLAACGAETRQKVLSKVFDGFTEEAPPKRRVTRNVRQEIDELKRELQLIKQGSPSGAGPAAKKGGQASPFPDPEDLPIAQAKTWEEASKQLPKDGSGNIDWVEALEIGTVAPRPGYFLGAENQAIIDMDIELTTSPNKYFPAVFSHGTHTPWLACGSCHPKIFSIKRQKEPPVITMKKIEAGEYCGVCHGRVAFGTKGRCYRCHTNIPSESDWKPKEKPTKPIESASSWEEAKKLLPVTAGMPDWSKALAQGVISPKPGLDPKTKDQPVFPITVERIPAGQALFKVVFPHAAHTALLGCLSCHPALFQMQRGATPMSMSKINAGESCGVCHGKVAFPATACGRCHPALAGGK